MSEGIVTVLGEMVDDGYKIEIVDPVSGVIQKDDIRWDAFPDKYSHQDIVEAFLMQYIAELKDSEFILEYHCGASSCYGSHVMTSAEFTHLFGEDTID